MKNMRILYDGDKIFALILYLSCVVRSGRYTDFSQAWWGSWRIWSEKTTCKEVQEEEEEEEKEKDDDEEEDEDEDGKEDKDE